MRPTSNPPTTPAAAAEQRSRFDETLDLDFFKAVAEPSRARLLSCLLKCGRPCTVTEIAACCELDLSTVSRHLASLAGVGLLRMEKRGRTAWYAADRHDLARRFRSLADAVEDLDGGDGCCESGDCGEPTDACESPSQ